MIDVCRDDDSSDEEGDEAVSGSEDEFGEKRRKYDEDSMRRRRERREWEEKRNRFAAIPVFRIRIQVDPHVKSPPESGSVCDIRIRIQQVKLS